MPRWKRLLNPARRYSIFLAPVLLLVTLLAWSVASPVGSSPDEDFHLASIWCGQGEREGVCEPGATAVEQSVPAPVAGGICYALESSLSAECYEERMDAPVEQMVSTGRGNFTSIYPAGFYWVNSLLVGENVETSVLAMRALNAILVVGVLTALYALLPRSRRNAVALAVTITLIPLGAFLVASINPSGWAIFAALAVFVGLSGFFESEGRRRYALGGVTLVAAFMGTGSRADSAAYVVVAAFSAIFLHWWRPGTASWWRPVRLRWSDLVAPALVLTMAAAFFFASRQSRALSSGNTISAAMEDPTADTPGKLGMGQLLWDNGMNVPSLWAGVFGSWDLGWLDTEMPAFVAVGGLVVFGAIVFTALPHVTRRDGLVLAGILGLLWLLPMVLMFRANAPVGGAVQPRYIMPLMVLLAGVALWRSAVGGRLSRGQLGLMVATLALANSFAMHNNIRRYVTGDDVTGFNLNALPEWWWDSAVSPMVVWLVGSAAFAGFLLAIVSRMGAWDRTPGAGTRAAVPGDEPLTVS
ncbi:putative membrane protein DUF2142 [Georgenia soli]|uniref:Putative membrane protein DUF2142 n=1 Tax=Georgenia soli TaxID=638953 RepID=A0A2A9EJJ0_9MICO|nr:DUF2142 domain-containing protein [Georgenia soli]PFG38691.1 putative membrane protein DUF2142 [Georgenia soli]